MTVNRDGAIFGSDSVADGYRVHLEPVIFRPWAERLVDFIDIETGECVLDVAAGTGVVSRVVATRVGATGRVIASDISAQMLAHVHVGVDQMAAPIETLACSATELELADGTFDAVFCQQGMQFIPDRVAAAREMRRVLRPGGRAGVAVWHSGQALVPFMTYAEVLRDLDVPEPFPGAYEQDAFTMSPEELESCLSEAGFQDIVVKTESMVLIWASPQAAVLGITGTPYGPALAALEPTRQETAATVLREAMTADDGDAVRRVMKAVFASGRS